jgi:hypothetical protein
MGKQLNNEEIKIALKKIRGKYDKLVTDFKKSRVISEAFEERYMSVLKSRQDLSIFILAEIEAVEELYKKEESKKEKELSEKPEKQEDKKSLADKIFEENRLKIVKYPKMDLGYDSDEEASRLLGAVRQYLNDYFPAITYIYKERRHTSEGDKLNDYYNKLLTQYDYKGDFPIARQYIASLFRQPRDFKKVDYEHRFIMQETAFLLNDIVEILDQLIKKSLVPMPETKLVLQKKEVSPRFFELFNGITFEESIKKNFEFLSNILTDFRFKGFKKSYKV